MAVKQVVWKTRRIKPGLVCLALYFVNVFCAYAFDLKMDYSKGPLYGKNLYIPFLIHYNFPSLSAKSGERFDIQYHISFYYVQDAHYANNVSKNLSKNVRSYDKVNVLRDYESAVGEFGAAYNFTDHLQAGMDMRVISYYGGVLDPLFESFHNIFDFASGAREYFEQNRLFINIPNKNGIMLFLDEPVFSFGDIDLWGKWTFHETPRVSLAALGAFKLPTGKLKALSGSGHTDIGLGILSDIRLSRLVTLYGQAGMVAPFDQKVFPMFNGLAGLEIHPWSFLSFVFQMNIKTSPISDDTVLYTWNQQLGVNFHQYSLPQTNLLVGLVMQYKDFKWQLYFEEDTITNQGADLTVNLMFMHTFNMKN